MGRPSSLALATRRWRQFLANRGTLATLKTLAQGCLRRLSRRLGRKHAHAPASTPSELWRNAAAAPPTLHPFDLEHGTDTSGLIWGEDLITGHAHDAWNTAYYAIAPSAFAQALSLLGASSALDWRECTFIDLGCGKGRALLLANLLGFRHALGVELSPALYSIARQNLTAFASPVAQRPCIDVILADAAAFPWDQTLATPVIFFLYNPFSRPVLDRFLRKLHAWLRAFCANDAVYFVYVNPELDSSLTRRPWIEKLWQQTMAISEQDQLADRFGSTTETIAAYRCISARERILREKP